MNVNNCYPAAHLSGEWILTIYDIIEQYGLATTYAERHSLAARRNVRFTLNGHKCGVFRGDDGKLRYRDFEASGTKTAGDAIDLIRAITGCSYREALQRLGLENEWTPLRNPVKEDLSDRKPDEIDLRNLGIIRETEHSEKHLEGALKQRGISLYDIPDGIRDSLYFIENCQLISKSSGKTYSVSGLVFDYGDACKIRRVSISKKEYDFTPSWGNKNLSIGPLRLFNRETLRTSLPEFVTEGELDALTIIQYGFPAVSIPGASNGHLLMNFIRRERLSPFLILALDKDTPGRDCADSLMDKLGEEYIPFIEVGDFHGSKDLNELQMKSPYDCESIIADAAKKAMSLINQ